ncbi:biliverdin-producing heme oxygenase [Rhodoblastus acidophilus]|uniref:Biliverdin-producing heme oxygenase n=1 Tax=Rhodoblastus acidophilus TaxID=1074 RepID=A0A6N8DME3_RHOAC|nr:biliverdin-producing heme oxygenase [Rhodoblastus acidophilus]MCW2273043.1 heme oxygenase [Rhodoblastus acidophilus]MTV29944.1 biliverdin-producing heme oxygenase [Rhodoblastus acidophilus]
MRPQSETSRAARLDGRGRLREATRAAHERLHGQRLLAPLGDGSIGLPAYRALLGRLYGFHAPLEGLVAASPWADRSDAALLAPRAPRLRKDLIELGAEAADLERLPMVAASDLPDLGDYGRFVGCLYVRAGSTLGARLLSKALDPLLGAGNSLGRGFLAGGDGADLQWRACCAAIDGATAAGDWDAMLSGADETFSALEAWLDAA